ncbi:gamma-glutamyltransferase [Nitrospina gracilis]|uniref:gamma-glutamyltransferase n=1 Tax=Nitrospina gracilis TaxID=35801 RepID=UPI001F00332D|nr:gamma-glutamyltransferase [Nitrospina gracilis]MCF8721267.1 gamma-glutamyltranspeptidase/glutathione hydrolase [Nitrospina gracilis Nb-211]
MQRLKFGRILAAGLLVLVLPLTATAQLKNIYSQRDRFHPEVGSHGMVVSQEKTASNIGVDILKKGGNAVDAAIAIGFALAVTLPRAGNIGGGGFMMVHLAKTGETVVIDYREKAPAQAHRDMYLNPDGTVNRHLLEAHHLASGIPGTVAGLWMAHEKYGRLPWKDLVAPAIKLAERGILINNDHVFTITKGKKRLKEFEATRKMFFKADGSMYKLGERIAFPDLAGSLKLIAEQGPSAFYEGEIAQKIAADMQANGGIISLDDLKNYKPVLREPVRGTYRGFEVVSMPPPSAGGIQIIQILNILENYPLQEYGSNTAQTLHLIAEAMRRSFADRGQYMGDADYWPVPVETLVSKAYAGKLSRDINTDRATPSWQVKPGEFMNKESDETTHFSVMDEEGNVVTNTYTLNFSFGSGIVVPGTGILLNNEMDDFSAKAGAKNAYGLLGGDANAIQPGKKPLSSMCPTIVFKNGKPLLATGSPGGPRLTTATLQVLINVMDFGMNIAAATNAPRIHHQWMPDRLRVEKGLSQDTIDILKNMGHDVRVTNTIGSTQTVMRKGKFFFGASDPRRPGAAAKGY